MSLSLLAAAPAVAQRSDDDLARAHFESGSAYYEQGRYEDAARAFMESYDLSPRPALLENAARAYERALLFDEAIRTLETLREQEPERSATIEDRIASMERLRARVHGGRPAEPDATPTRPTPTTPTPTTPSPTTPSPTTPESGTESVSEPGIALTVTGGVLVLGALITGLAGHFVYEDLTAVCSAERVCPLERQGDIDTGAGLVVTSTVLTFAGPIAAAVGVILLVLDSGESDEHADMRLVPGPGEAGLALKGRF